MKKIFFILFLLVACNPPAEKKDSITGKVVSVADGDTMTILTGDGKRIRIRLLGIDAPERGQDFGTKAREFLNDLCYGKTVTVEKNGEDQYDRLLGVVYVDGENINEKMVRNGLAWYYRYFVDDRRLDSLEQLARTEKLNIWSMENPVSPYDFKKNRRNN